MSYPKLSIDYAINGRVLEGYFDVPAEIHFLLPGMLLVLENNPQSDTPFLREHHVVDGAAFPLIATETPYGAHDIDHKYFDDGTIYYRHCLPGDVFMGIADPNTFLDIEAGTLVSSAGNGKLHAIPDGFLYDRTIVGCALAVPGTAESYKYFAINGVSLKEVYARSESEYYLTEPMEIVMLRDRFPVEVI